MLRSARNESTTAHARGVLRVFLERRVERVVAVVADVHGEAFGLERLAEERGGFLFVFHDEHVGRRGGVEGRPSIPPGHRLFEEACEFDQHMLLGVAAISQAGSAAVLYYLTGYLFTVLAAFVVLSVALRHVEGEDISSLAGLHPRSPLLAAALVLAAAAPAHAYLAALLDGDDEKSLRRIADRVWWCMQRQWRHVTAGS